MKSPHPKRKSLNRNARHRPRAAPTPSAGRTLSGRETERIDKEIFVSNRASTTAPQRSNAAQEASSAAERLNTQVDDALAAVASPSGGGAEELEASADRIERTARDLSIALRELASRKRGSSDT